MSFIDLTRDLRTQPKGTSKKKAAAPLLDQISAAVPPPPAPLPPTVPQYAYGTDGSSWWAGMEDPLPDFMSLDAGMLGAFSKPSIYEDGSLGDGGSYVDAGFANPWTTPWTGDTGQAIASGIDTWMAPPDAERDASGNWWDSGAQAWRDPNSGQLWNGSGWGATPPPPVGIDEALFQQQPNPRNAYPDFGEEIDRAYFQQVAPPANPQDAMQRFLFDPPKIDPENIDSGGDGWLGPVGKGISEILKTAKAGYDARQATNPSMGTMTTSGNQPVQSGPAGSGELGLMFSGEKTLGALGIDTSGLPDEWYFPVRQAVDTAAAPATILTAGAGSSVPIVGSAFGGNFATRMAGETALGTAGLLGSEAGGNVAARYTDNPYIIGGAATLSGLLAGAGAYGAIRGAKPGIRAADDALMRLDAAINEPVPGANFDGTFTRGMAVDEPTPHIPQSTPPISEVLNPKPAQAADRWAPEFGTKEDAQGSFGMGSTEGGRKPVPGQGNTQIQPETPSWRMPDPDRMAGATESQRIAAKDFRNIYLAKEEQLRISGVAANEIREGRAGQAARIGAAREAAENAGLTGKEAADFVRSAASGALRDTTIDIPPSVMDEVDWMYATINKAYPTSQFDYLSAESALTEALTTGNIEPRQLDILKAIFGDEMPDVERIAAQVGGRASTEATTMPLDLGDYTKAGQPPLIGEQGMNLPERPANPLDPSGPSVPVDTLKARDEAMVAFDWADTKASTVERQAVGTSKGEWQSDRAVKRNNRPLSAKGQAKEDSLWQKKLADAKDQGAATEAMRLRSDADAIYEKILESESRLEFPKGEGPRGGQGAEMQTTTDILPRQDLTLRNPTAADVGLGVVPLGGKATPAVGVPTLKSKIGRGLIEATGLPRAFKAGGDLSATFRQSAALGISHPKEWGKAFKAQAKAWATEEGYQRVIAEIDASPYAGIRDKVVFMGHKAGTNLNQREEAFLFSWANDLIPDKLQGANIFKKGERAYVAMLDKLRSGVFDNKMRSWEAEGYVPSEEDVRRLGEFINHATGRGTGKIFDQHGALMSAALFAPRYIASKPQMFWDLVVATPAVRKEVAKSIGIWMGSVATLYGLAEASEKAGVWDGEVGIGPLSGGFGKIQAGSYGIDLTSGFAGELRTAMQFLKGGYKDADGAFVPRGRDEIAGRWFRGKLSPNAALAWDLTKGQDYMGRDVNLTSLDGAQRAALNTFGNLFAEDIVRVFREEFGDGDYTAQDVMQFGAAAVASLLGIPSGIRDKTFQMKKEDAYTKWAKTNGVQETDWRKAGVLERTRFEKENLDLAADEDSALGGIKAEAASKQAALEDGFTKGLIPTLGEYNQTRKDNAIFTRGRYEQATKDLPDKKLADEVYQSYLDIFDRVTDPATGYFDPEKFAKEEMAWEKSHPKEYVEAVALARNDGEVEKPRRAAIKQLADDGYFMGDENSMKRYIGMVSGTDEETIADLNQQVTLAGKDPKYAMYDDFGARALIALKDKGVDTMTIIDVINSNKKKFQNPEFVIYKIKHPDLLIWLDDQATWDVIQANQKKP